MNIQFKQVKSYGLYPLGYTFEHKRGKQEAKLKTVLNYAITHNANGSVTNFEYVLSYDFMGQRMIESVPQTTIDLATNNGWKELKS